MCPCGLRRLQRGRQQPPPCDAQGEPTERSLARSPDWYYPTPECVTDPKLEAQRQRYLEYLYEWDGRSNPEHPQHALYTGLAEKRTRLLKEQDFLAVCASQAVS